MRGRGLVFVAMCSLSLMLSGCNTQSDDDLLIPTISLPSDKTSGLDGEFIIDIGKATLVPNEERQLLLEEWQGVNEKVGVLVNIEDYDIDEPVLCGVDDNKQWLRTDINGKYNVAGTVFLDYRCNINIGLTKLIHGHNMKNGSMFGNLPLMLELDSCTEAPIIELTYPEGVARYEVFAVLSVDATKEALPLDIFATAEETMTMLEDLKARSLVPDGVIHSVDSLVLNTCWYGESGVEHNLHCIVAASRV